MPVFLGLGEMAGCEKEKKKQEMVLGVNTESGRKRDPEFAFRELPV